MTKSNDVDRAPVHDVVLLPCPFCHSRSVNWVYVEETGEGYHLCDGCSARGPACFHCPDGLVDGHWNRRTTIDGARAVLESMGFHRESIRSLAKRHNIETAEHEPIIGLIGQ